MNDLAEITLYRCLQSIRSVEIENDEGDEEYIMHDECADIIARNPNIRFEPGLTSVEVDHLIHKGTHWDADPENFPRIYVENYQGRLGYIVVSVRYRVGSALSEPSTEPRFCRSVQSEAGIRDWYVASNTTVARVRVENVVNVVRLDPAG